MLEETTTMFEQCTRLKLRWHEYGVWSIEDLWDMLIEPDERYRNRVSLEGIYKKLSRQLRENNEASLLNKPSSEDKVLSLKLGIVKYIYEVRTAEKEAITNSLIKKARKDHLLSIQAKNQDNALYELSEDELQQLIDNM